MKRRIEAKIVNEVLRTKYSPPTYATIGSSAMDLRACIDSPVVLKPGERTLVPTGIALNTMDPSLTAIVASRSGLSLNHGIHVAQGIGVVDSDFGGEIKVILMNSGSSDFEILPGHRIAQLLFMPVVQVDLGFVEEFTGSTERGDAAFGSSGTA